MEDSVCIIVGITEDGEEFRPRDWCKRLAGSASVFDTSKRLQYHKRVKPCYIDEYNSNGVYIECILESEDPHLYEFLMKFKDSNKLVLLTGRKNERQ